MPLSRLNAIFARRATGSSAAFVAGLGSLTYDDATKIVGTGFLVAEEIGPNRAFTPDGFLLCKDVAIARTGEMLYARGETPLPVGDSGYLIVERHEEDVFNPKFIASFAGKPVTNDHPRTPEGVTPQNFRQLVVGTILNPRRGEGALDQYIVADLLIKDADAIRDIMTGKREVSAGYATDYIPLKPGRARQVDMMANHVALVASGRCGASCHINDHKGEDMRAHARDEAPKKPAWYETLGQKIAAAFDKKDKAALDAALDEGAALAASEDKHVHIHAGGSMALDEASKALIAELGAKIEGLSTRVAAQDAQIAELKAAKPAVVTDADKEKEAIAEESEEKDREKAKMATDSSFLATSHQEAVSGAEALVPGMSIPTYDKAAAPKATFDAICGLRRRALDLFGSTQDGRAMIEQANGGKRLALDQMDCRSVKALFRSVVTAKKAATDAAQRAYSGHQQRQQQRGDAPKGVTSLSELNKRNAEHYAKHA